MAKKVTFEWHNEGFQGVLKSEGVTRCVTEEAWGIAKRAFANSQGYYTGRNGEELIRHGWNVLVADNPKKRARATIVPYGYFENLAQAEHEVLSKAVRG